MLGEKSHLFSPFSLQGVVERSAQTLVSLANQWEKHRAPLIEEYRRLKEENAGKVSESQKKLEDIKELRERMKEVAEDTRAKDQLHKQLVRLRKLCLCSSLAYNRKILKKTIQ